MEGRGVSNYDIDKPSFSYSTSTTEFDDALLQRGIITLEQAMAAKGASTEEAQRLVRVKQQQQQQQQEATTTTTRLDAATEECSDDDESNDSFSDDDFLEQYRAMRLSQLRQEKEQQPSFGQVIDISRSDWNKQVNEASNETWVVVTLTSCDTNRTGCTEAAVSELAPKFPLVKFVTIPSKAAIENWPDSNLPTIFLYRYGKLQHELIRIRTDTSADQLEWKLAQLNVLETDMEEEPLVVRKGGSLTNKWKYNSSSTFGGTMAQLATLEGDAGDDNDSYS